MLKSPIHQDCLGLCAYWARFSKMQRNVYIFKTDSGDQSHFKAGACPLYQLRAIRSANDRIEHGGMKCQTWFSWQGLTQAKSESSTFIISH